MLLGSPPDMVRKAPVAQDPNIRMLDSTSYQNIIVTTKINIIFKGTKDIILQNHLFVKEILSFI